MKDYIEREALIKEGWHLERQVYGNGYVAIEIKQLKDVPAAGVKPVARGEWIADDIADNIFHCNICDGDAPVDCTSGREYESNFCPNCGADMRGEN